MKNIKVHYSRKTDDWKTPKKIYEYFIKYHGMKDCFPYQANYDEFKKEYDHENLFINPPFSKMNKVIEWTIHQVIDRKCTAYLLIPARTDTKYFHKLLKYQPEIVFIEGRLHYNDSNSAPFPTLLVILKHPDGTLPIYKSIKREQINEI